jgi:hypothetical protein
MKGEMVKTNFNVPTNPNRQERKKERGFGKLSFGKMNEVEWCQSHDLLFKVKGKERWRKINLK